MDISVIIPVFNAAVYIENCLNALFNQTKTTGVEYILVNDCSSDSSMQIIDSLKRTNPQLMIRVINHTTNRGVSAARQTGLNAANGKYVLYVDSDDYCKLSALQTLFVTAEQHDLDILLFDFYQINSDGESKYCSAYTESASNTDYIVDLVCKYKGYSLWTKFIRRSLFEEHNIKFNSNINCGEDALISLELFCISKKIKYIPTALYHYVCNPASIMQTLNTRKLEESNIMLTIELEKTLNKYNLAERFKSEIIGRKFEAKQIMLLSVSSSERTKYARLFPEIAPYVFKQKQLPFYLRLSLWLTSHNILTMYNILTTIHRLKN